MSYLTESRRTFIHKSAIAGGILLPSVVHAQSLDDEMVYRSLGRTGFKVSEIVLGTFPFDTDESHGLFDLALERGVNYFDCAAAYSKGDVEKNLGRYFKKTGKRDELILSTKLSAYYGIVERFSQEIMKGLPNEKKQALRKQAQDLIAERMVKHPGYHIDYFGGQAAQFDKAYLRYVVLKEYGMKVEWKSKIKAHAYKLLEEAMERLQTDHIDVLHIPHGCAMPEMMDDILKELFSEFKQKGMIRASAVSFHNDVTNNLVNATDVGFYDVAMFAYNIANHAGLEAAIYKANQSGMGLIAMKVAKLFDMTNQPPWREEKLNAVLPDEDLSLFAKSYLWALQNPHLSCCVSQMENPAELYDNLQVVGRKVDLAKA